MAKAAQTGVRMAKERFIRTPLIVNAFRRLRPKFTAWVRVKLKKYQSMPNRGRRKYIMATSSTLEMTLYRATAACWPSPLVMASAKRSQ